MIELNWNPSNLKPSSNTQAVQVSENLQTTARTTHTQTSNQASKNRSLMISLSKH